MEPTTKETLEQAYDATLEQPVTITVDIHPQGQIHRRLQHWGLLPKQRVFTLRPIVLGSLFRTSKLLLSIDLRLPGKLEEGQESSLLQVNYEAIERHIHQIAEIVAIALQNNRHPVKKSLTRFILQNFTTKELAGVLALVLQQMDLTNFMRSIISVKGVTVRDNGKPVPAISVNGSEVSL